MLAIIMASLIPVPGARAEALSSEPDGRQGSEVSSSYETSERASDGSSGSSRGRDAYLERIIGHCEAGSELEYDLPRGSTPEVRVDAWLKAGELTRKDCGRLIFTWNAFRIECDPDSVIETIKAFDLTAVDLRDNAAFEDPDARAPGTQTKTTAGPSGATFHVIVEVSPNAVRRANAETDVGVGEIMRKPMTLADALRERAKEEVTGTISITFNTDPTGTATRKIKVTTLEIKRANGVIENSTSTRTLERRPLSSARVDR